MNSNIDRRRFLEVAGTASLGAAMGACNAGVSPSQRPPNFIILFADDMGYGDLTSYGHPTIRTPNLDAMAGEGVRLTSFYCAAPVCTPSRAGLLTGRYPVRAGQPDNLGPESVGGLPLSEITLAQLLKDHGYRTKCIGKWHLGYNPTDYLPTSRGFDSYLGLPYSNDMTRPWVNTDHPLELYRDTEPIELMTDQSDLTERYTAEALDFIRASANDPFFLYLPYAMPHLPVSASHLRGQSRAGLYGDVIETLDWSAGEILRTVQDQGIDDNTMVVFTSDNGPWLDLPDRMLQDGVERWHAGFKGLLRGWKANTYEGGMRVPSIFRWPGVIPAQPFNADIASTLDLFPTVAAAAGAPLPDDRVYDGFNLLPALRGEAASPREEFFYCRSTYLEAVRQGSWKCRYTRNARPELAASDPITPELFNLDEDPAEQYNRYDRNSDVGDRLLERMHTFAVELGAEIPA